MEDSSLLHYSEYKIAKFFLNYECVKYFVLSMKVARFHYVIIVLSIPIFKLAQLVPRFGELPYLNGTAKHDGNT